MKIEPNEFETLSDGVAAIQAVIADNNEMMAQHVSEPVTKTKRIPSWIITGLIVTGLLVAVLVGCN